MAVVALDNLVKPLEAMMINTYSRCQKEVSLWQCFANKGHYLENKCLYTVILCLVMLMSSATGRTQAQSESLQLTVSCNCKGRSMKHALVTVTLRNVSAKTVSVDAALRMYSVLFLENEDAITKGANSVRNVSQILISTSDFKQIAPGTKIQKKFIWSDFFQPLKNKKQRFRFIYTTEGVLGYAAQNRIEIQSCRIYSNTTVCLPYNQKVADR